MMAIFQEIFVKLGTSAKRSSFKNKMVSRRTNALVASFILGGTAAVLALGQVTPARNTLPPVVAPTSYSQESPQVQADGLSPIIVTGKQKRAIVKSNFEKIKKDTEELYTLAKSLQEEVDKSNENVLSLKIVEKAEKIENLAKKIKNSAKGE